MTRLYSRTEFYQILSAGSRKWQIYGPLFPHGPTLARVGCRGGVGVMLLWSVCRMSLTDLGSPCDAVSPQLLQVLKAPHIRM